MSIKTSYIKSARGEESYSRIAVSCGDIVAINVDYLAGQDSIREALEAGRTIAYGFGHLCGPEELLLDLFKASVKLSPVDGKKVALTNMTSIPYIIKKENGNPVRIAPFSTYNTSIPQGAATLSFTVLNIWTGENTHLKVELPIK